jgi:hypothetical protein
MRRSLIPFSWAQEIRSMMGERRVMQEALFYGFSLEQHVPDDHMLRKIDRFVYLSGLRAHLGPYYSDIGRPSIDPELMMRMLIVGYFRGNTWLRSTASRSPVRRLWRQRSALSSWASVGCRESVVRL